MLQWFKVTIFVWTRPSILQKEVTLYVWALKDNVSVTQESKRKKPIFNLWKRSHDKATWVCIRRSLPEDISVSQASEWIQLKTPLFESPARISTYKSMPDVTAALQEHTRCQGESSDCLICFYKRIFEQHICLPSKLIRQKQTENMLSRNISPLKRDFFFFFFNIGDFAVELGSVIYCMHAVCYPLSLTV